MKYMTLKFWWLSIRHWRKNKIKIYLLQQLIMHLSFKFYTDFCIAYVESALINWTIYINKIKSIIEEKMNFQDFNMI
ncbi:unnamed protein product [Blepharisma stoltei]|uniref:Uncharacterized protein n=1 Tax=Blepharisma stoltei TaxID=1481888 RepID=A0AAU9JKA1_9CILI|nr:unnamed protein product [Blepharisma stoltei]